MTSLKKLVKVVGAVLGITAIAVAVREFLTAVDDDLYEDEECEEDESDTLSACEEDYDRGYSHGIRGLPYAGKNPAALAFQEIAVAETMAEYGEIVRENLQADVVEPYISDDSDSSGEVGKISDAFNHEDRGNAYNEAGRTGSASE